MKTKIGNKMKYAFVKGKIKIGKHSPEILLVTGIVGVVTSAVLACVATTKASEIIEETNESLAQVKKCSEDTVLLEKYSPEDKRKDLTIIYVKTGVKLAKVYLPAVALGALSIFSIVSSNNVLKKRNAEIAAAYSALGIAFSEYRKRVTDKLGEDADRELYCGVRAKEFITQETDPDTGEVTEKKDILDVVEDDPLSPFAFYFEKPNMYCEDSINGNLLVLGAKEQIAELERSARASKDIPLFWNEVGKTLGLDPTKPGQRAGWGPNDVVKFNAQVVKKPDGCGGYYSTILVIPNCRPDVLSEWK